MLLAGLMNGNSKFFLKVSIEKFLIFFSHQERVFCLHFITYLCNLPVFRFLLSLASCSRCLVVDDKLNVLPISSQTLFVTPVGKVDTSESDKELAELKESLRDTQPVSALLNCCKTLDQVKILSC